MKIRNIKMKIGGLYEIEGCLVRLKQIGARDGIQTGFFFEFLAGSYQGGHFETYGRLRKDGSFKRASDLLLYADKLYKSKWYIEAMKS